MMNAAAMASTGHHQAQRVVLHRHLLDLFDLFQVVDAFLAIADKRRCQPDDHAQRRDAHGMGDVDTADVHAATGNVGQQDFVEENVAEAHRQEHVRRDQAERHDAGDQATVQLQLGQHIETVAAPATE